MSDNKAFLQRLTLDDKFSLLGGTGYRTTAVERAGVPEFIMADGPIGVHHDGTKGTAYPATICLAATWNRHLALRMGECLGRDCRARGVHFILGPGVNLLRLPVCGRNFEYMGEDPVLTGTLAAQYIRGAQKHEVCATIKHMACNYQEYDRHRISSDADERTLREIYFRAFEMAVKEAHVGAVMTAYNLINGQHCSEHEWMIDAVLRKEWGFPGLVISDWLSTYSGVASASVGLDIEMPKGDHLNAKWLKPALDNGLITEADIDEKICHMLDLARRFRWLERPQKDPRISLFPPEHAQVAADIAREGIVLLRNKNKILPFDRARIRKIAVIGLHGSTIVAGGGGSANQGFEGGSALVDALRKLAGDKVEITAALGLDLLRHQKAPSECEFTAPDGKRGMRGEYFTNQRFEGAPSLQRVDTHIDFSWFCVAPADGFTVDTYSIRWTGAFTAKETSTHNLYMHAFVGSCRIWIDGKLIVDSSAIRHGGVHVATLELKAGQSVSLKIEYVSRRSWNGIHVAIEPASLAWPDYDRMLTLAREADAVVVATGFLPDTESEELDRSFGLPNGAARLIGDVAEANPNVVTVIWAGGGVDPTGWLDKTKALLWTWFPGQEGGQALAEILLGDTNPSGKLPCVFAKRLEDHSAFDSYWDDDHDLRVQLADGVFGGQRHFDRAGIKPLYPFGFGLSYTKFTYENLRLSGKTLTSGKALKVQVDVVNTGKREGSETVQLYVAPPKGNVPRPAKELKAFDKVTLQPKERKTLTFTLRLQDLQYFDLDEKTWRVTPGRHKVLLASSATDIRAQAMFHVRQGS